MTEDEKVIICFEQIEVKIQRNIWLYWEKIYLWLRTENNISISNFLSIKTKISSIMWIMAYGHFCSASHRELINKLI